MELYRALAQLQFPCDLLVELSGSDAFKNLALSLGQSLDLVPRNNRPIFAGLVCSGRNFDLRAEKIFNFAFCIEDRRHHHRVAERSAIFFIVEDFDHDRNARSNPCAQLFA